MTDLSLRVAMGALCVLTGAADSLQVGCKPGDAPAGALALTGVTGSRIPRDRQIALRVSADSFPVEILPQLNSYVTNVRGEQVIMAHHDTVIENGDHVILFLSDKRHVEQVERLFQT